MIGYSVALLCLSLNVYHEAGNQSVVGKEAVADVVATRALENGSNVCTETLRRGQFSWVKGRNITYLEADKKRVLAKTKRNQAELDAWNESQSVAALVLSQTHLRFHFDQYHTTAVHPRWKRVGKEVKIGSHLFSRGKAKCLKTSCLSAASSHVAFSQQKHTTTSVMTTTTHRTPLWSLPKLTPIQLLPLTAMVTLPSQPAPVIPQLPPFTVNTHSEITFGAETDEKGTRTCRNGRSKFFNWLRRIF